VVHERVRDGNTALEAGAREAALAAFADVAIMTGILGMDPLDPAWKSAGTSAEASALDTLIQTMITQRADARAAKDWAAADRIRDAIAAAGIALEDTADGTHWALAGAREGMKEN
jgi:cysteinyl-tRNA synthetase